MKTWVKILLVALAFGTLLLLWSFFKSDEQYKLLESQAYNLIGSDFAKDQRTEFCYDLGDRIVAVHEMGFDAEKCASLTPKQFEFALFNVQSCEMSCTNNSMDDTSRRLCNAACFAREFERDPITTQTALPLIMT